MMQKCHFRLRLKKLVVVEEEHLTGFESRFIRRKVFKTDFKTFGSVAALERETRKKRDDVGSNLGTLD